MPTRLSPRRPMLESLPALSEKRMPAWIHRLLETPRDVSLALIRLVLGGVMFAHASQKVLGWFGGPGISGTIQGFHDHLGIPTGVAILVMLTEFLGSIGLLFGFLGRLGALGIVAIMVGAIVLVHSQFGFFMNWYGKAPGEGFEYHLLAIALAIPILARGSGALSVDRWLAGRNR